MSRRASVSLGNELDAVREAVRAARMLADLVRHGEPPDEECERLAPHACSAVLALVECRLRLVVQTITGQAPASGLVTAHNRVSAPVGQDVLIPIDDASRPTSSD